MTPTLFGRWQTRIFLLATVGLLVTWAFSTGFLGVHPGPVYFWILFYFGLIGLLWDVLYNSLQQFMWDHDWPGVFQFFAAIAEGILLAILSRLGVLPFVDGASFNLRDFLLHYSVTWLVVYLLSWVVMRLLFPRWRFRGGEWIGKWRRA